jgi:hypothetical protein
MVPPVAFANPHAVRRLDESRVLTEVVKARCAFRRRQQLDDARDAVDHIPSRAVRSMRVPEILTPTFPEILAP